MQIPFLNTKSSLRFKIALLFVMLVIVMMAIVTYIFTIREMNLRVEQVKLHMERLANTIATICAVDAGDASFYQTYINNQLTANPDIVYIAIFNEFQDFTAHALNSNWIGLRSDTRLSETEANLIRQLDQGQITDESRRDLKTISVDIMMGGQIRGHVRVGFSLIEMNDDLRDNLYANLGLGFLFTVLAIIISWYMSRQIVNPLSRLTKAMAGIAIGDFDQKIRIESRDEIGTLAKTFNLMTNGLREKAEIESFSQDLGFLIEPDKIYQMISARIAGAVHADAVYLFLRRDKQLCKICLVYSAPNAVKSSCFLECSYALHRFFKSDDTPRSFEDLREHPDLQRHLAGLTEVQPVSLICPVMVMDDLVGLLFLNGRDGQPGYTEAEKQFLKTLVRQAGFALENAVLIQELSQQERMKQELAIAREVQKGLLPASAPELPGIRLYGFCKPANEIGGDYYDFFDIDATHHGIVIADVTGKGASAAFYMAMVKGMMLSLTPAYPSPRKLLCELNRRLFGIVDRRIFITMIYAMLDTENRTLTFSRAGHNSLIVRNTICCKIESHIPKGIGLGLEQGNLFDQSIDEKAISLDENSCVIFYTDGITEAQNHSEEEFGEARLMQALQQADTTDAKAICDLILHAVRRFTDGADQHDDMTLITLCVGGIQ